MENHNVIGANNSENKVFGVIGFAFLIFSLLLLILLVKYQIDNLISDMRRTSVFLIMGVFISALISLILGNIQRKRNKTILGTISFFAGIVLIPLLIVVVINVISTNPVFLDFLR